MKELISFIHSGSENYGAVLATGVRKYCTTSSDSDVDTDDLANLAQGLTDSIQELEELTDSLGTERLSFEEHVKSAMCTCGILASQNLPDLEWVVRDAAKSRAEENSEGVDPAGQQTESLLEQIATTQARLTLITKEKPRGPPTDVLESKARAAELKSLLETRITPAVRDTLAAYKELKAVTAETDDKSDESGTGDSPMEESGTDPDCGEE